MGGTCEKELQDLTTRLDDRAWTCGIELSKAKGQVMVSSSQYVKVKINMENSSMKSTPSSTYLGAIIPAEGSEEIRTRIGLVAAVTVNIKLMWKTSKISTATNIKLVNQALCRTC